MNEFNPPQRDPFGPPSRDPYGPPQRDAYGDGPREAFQPPGPRRRIPASACAWGITLINVLIFIGMELTGGSQSGRNLVRWGANAAALIAQGEYWRLLTSGFIHIGLPHLLFNSFALLTFGRLAEMIYGHSRFLAMYLV